MPLMQQLGDYAKENKAKTATVGGTVSIGLLAFLFSLFVTEKTFNMYREGQTQIGAQQWRELQDDLSQIRKELDRCVKVERHYQRTNQPMRINP